LPEIARSIGRTIEELRKASQDFRDQVMDIEQDAVDTLRSTASEFDVLTDTFAGEDAESTFESDVREVHDNA